MKANKTNKPNRANRAYRAYRAYKTDGTDRTMRKVWIEKSVVTAVMVLWWLVMPVMGYGSDGDSGSVAGMIAAHAAYMVSHANVWHLGGNLFVLWLWRGRLCLLPSLVIAFVCSFLPAVGFWKMGMTVGFSGVLFAMAGIRWGDYCRRAVFRHVAMAEFVIRVVPLALVGAVIPHVNWCLHAYCLVSGFALGRCWGMRDYRANRPYKANRANRANGMKDEG